MDTDGSIIFILLFILFVLLKALFVSSETAIEFLSDAKLKKQAEDGDKKAKRLRKIAKSASDYVDAMAFGSTSCTVWAMATAITYFWIASVKQQLTALPSSFRIIVAFIITAILGGFFLTVFGKFLPRKLASYKPEKIARFTCSFIYISRAILVIPLKLCSGVSYLFVRLFGIDPNKQQEDTTEEEILLMVDAGEEKGVIEETQKEMINNIFDFSDISASEIMTHRTEIVATKRDSTIEQVVQLAIEHGISRIPVYSDSIDNIIGVLFVKDFLKLIGEDTDNCELESYIRPILYVPDSNSCSEIFRLFSENKAHIAVVVDEYGGTAGIITMEDLLEAIVGNIQDEYDDEEEEIKLVSENTYEIDGWTDLDEVGELLDIAFDREEDDNIDTLGGFIINELGRIPKEDETIVVNYRGVEFTVIAIEERRIMKVRAVKLEVPTVTEEDE